MAAHAPITTSASPKIASLGDVKDSNWVISVISMLIAMQGSIANKNSHGRLPLNATKLTPISSNAQKLFNAARQPIAGLCPRPIDALM
jgi:hypothetical protein